MNGETARWSDLFEMTRCAEAVGFDSIWVTDHLIHREPGREVGPWECWSLISALAAVTTRVQIGTLVLCTGFRNPAYLAKMADTVDEISGGRLILGVGAGWNEPEYRAFGYPFDHRVDRFEEAIQIITGLLRNGRTDFTGRYHEARDCVLLPRSPSPNGPPILVGTGRGPRMFELTARFADSWNVWFKTFNNDVEELRALSQQVDLRCEAVGRDPTTLERTAAVKIAVGPHAPSTMSVDPIDGTPEQIAEEIRAFATIGIRHVQVWLEPNTAAGMEAFAPVLEHLDNG